MNNLKQAAAEKAAELVTSGMVLGLGTGSTAVFWVRAVGRLLQNGRLQNIVGIPTSDAIAQEAIACHIPLTTLDEHPVIDLAVDGADEIDPDLNLIKGLGGALLREKIVETAAKRMVVIADYTKRVNQLGERSPVPVEIVPMARRPVQVYLESLGARVVLRVREERPFLTDEGNFILDCYFGPIANPAQLSQAILAKPGVVEHGMFLGIASQAILGTPDGVISLTR